MTGYLSFPYQIDASGQTATTDLSTYVSNLILLVLETDPGERVNLPNFGAGLKSLVFAGMDNGLASAAETLVRSKLLQFLGGTISIYTLTVSLKGEQVEIDLTYTVTHTQQLTATTVTLPLAGSGSAPGGGAGRAVARIADT
ncbi:MAG TPA: GPW/gp25 family protein [Rhizomicrobium sp.]|jgi:phage baseplate assembly protein W|nr:GPW/gp25 family protein [Rhizomicrobium sp.]